MTDYDEEALLMWDYLTSFIAKYEVHVKAREKLKELNRQRADDRAYEAAIGQFVAQIEHIYEEGEE